MILTGGTRTPSWKISVASPAKPPGTMPAHLGDVADGDDEGQELAVGKDRLEERVLGHVQAAPVGVVYGR